MQVERIHQAEVGERHVVMTLDRTRLLLPQREIRILASMADIRPESPPPHGVGWIKFEERDRPVYELTDELVLGDLNLEHRRICALINADGTYIGFACSKVALLERALTHQQPVPQAMVTPHSPIYALLKLDDGIACVTSAASLAKYVAHASN